jgi:hypothetical protein
VATPDIEPNTQWEFFGLTYPDTSAGLAACNAEGSALHQALPQQNIFWQCRLNTPDPGYDLWIFFHSEGNSPA